MKDKGADPIETADALVRSMPRELALGIIDKADDPPLLRVMVTSYIATKRMELDMRVLDVAVRYFEKQAEVIRAAKDVRRATHENRRLDVVLGQEDELEDVTHETKVLEQKAAQEAHLAVIDQAQSARRREELVRLKLNQKIANTVGGDEQEPWDAQMRSALRKSEEVLVTYAEIHREIDSRTDITNEAKQASLEWLKEMATEEIRRRMKSSPSDSDGE
jgi:hypothetical protein